MGKVQGTSSARSDADPRATATARARPATSGPAYRHIADALSERIAAGTYRPGDQLPTEARLREEFGVSPMTVRRAINILLERGLVTTTQGKGTFVRSLDLGEAVFRLQELTDQWVADDSAEVQLLEATIVPASAEVAARLDSREGDPTIFLRRLIRRATLPLMYNLEYIVYDPSRPLVESQLEITSLGGLLQAGGGEGLPGGEVTIQAVALDPQAAELLEVPPGSPALSLEHRLHDFGRRPVTWGWFLCRADQFRLSTAIGAEAETGRGR